MIANYMEFVQPAVWSVMYVNDIENIDNTSRRPSSIQTDDIRCKWTSFMHVNGVNPPVKRPTNQPYVVVSFR